MKRDFRSELIRLAAEMERFAPAWAKRLMNLSREVALPVDDLIMEGRRRVQSSWSDDSVLINRLSTALVDAEARYVMNTPEEEVAARYCKTFDEAVELAQQSVRLQMVVKDAVIKSFEKELKELREPDLFWVKGCPEQSYTDPEEWANDGWGGVLGEETDVTFETAKRGNIQKYRVTACRIKDSHDIGYICRLLDEEPAGG